MTALAGIRVLELARVLAGPWAGQVLADLGAEVTKVESLAGDDTRAWGPPFVDNPDGSADAAYFHATNRGKRSIAIDFAHAEGREIVRALARGSDVLIENFKVGGLKKYGLDYETIRQTKPDIIYCSVTGFGQTGPYAPRAGYDYLAQGLGGIMSLTGEAEGEPMKVGVGIADVMCGMYATSAILAAVHYRTSTGQGQYIDLALLDTQVAWLVNEGLNYLTSGQVPRRLGNEHANIVPYKVMPCADGHFILAVGNDGQFRKFCEMAGCPELADDPRFATNRARVENRRALYDLLPLYTQRKTAQEWLEGLAARGVPAGAVNTLDKVFEDPQVQAREMKISMPYPDSPNGRVDLIGNPIKFSETPVTYRRHPPRMGEHTDEVLKEMLGLDETALSELRTKGAI